MNAGSLFVSKSRVRGILRRTHRDPMPGSDWLLGGFRNSGRSGYRFSWSHGRLASAGGRPRIRNYSARWDVFFGSRGHMRADGQ